MNPAILAAGLGVCAVLLFVELRQVLVDRQRPAAASPRRAPVPGPAAAEPGPDAASLPAPAPAAAAEAPAAAPPAPAPAAPPRARLPGRLGVPGEDSEFVLHKRPDAEAYSDQKLLVVGDGDAAVEAALSLLSRGNEVTMVCRGRDFIGLKPNNEVALRSAVAAGSLNLQFSSEVRRFAPGEAVLFFDGPAGRGELRLSVDRSFVLGV